MTGRTCPLCRATVTGAYALELTCCPFCLMPWNGSVPDNLFRLPDPSSTRRSRNKGTQKVKLIGARDGWICHLCGEHVDKTLPPEHPRSATCDHLVPHSKGGTNRNSNLKLAHRICNQLRGDAPLASAATA